MEQKTVLISYRRALSKHLARSIYQNLKMNGWDVFLDANPIDSGDIRPWYLEDGIDERKRKGVRASDRARG